MWGKVAGVAIGAAILYALRNYRIWQEPLAMDARLAAIRAAMAARGVAALVVPSDDAHMSEYVAPRDARRAYVSGFTGSAGTAVVTAAEAALWTDGRYFVQAERELDSRHWTLMRAGVEGTPTKEAWLAARLPPDSVVAVDGRTISVEAARRMAETLSKGAPPLRLLPLPDSIVDAVWDADASSPRPAAPHARVFALGVQHAGREAAAKVSDVRARLAAGRHAGVLLCALDEVAWLLNLRGGDVACTPVFFAFAYVSDSRLVVYVDADRLDSDALAQLSSLRAEVRPYGQVYADVSPGGDVHAEITASGKKLLVGGESCNTALVSPLWADEDTCVCGLPADSTQSVRPAACTKCGRDSSAANQIALFARPSRRVDVAGATPVQTAKAVKNSVELAGFRRAHVLDGAALVRYLAWLEEQLLNGMRVDECAGADALLDARAAIGGAYFRGVSFETISAAGPNGAVVHYKPERETAAMIRPDELYLVDSGGQYLGGTTDVTRTVFVAKDGTPSAELRDAYTRVLRGHVRLARAVFPRGTTGHQLDALARSALWDAHMDYRHGTGHGVGHFLGVHEGPPSISPRAHPVWGAPLAPGMVVSNEPGFYADGRFGIRIESLVAVVPHVRYGQVEDSGFLAFETLTLAPVQLEGLVARALLDDDDVRWIDAYHAAVREALAPLLADDSRAMRYLARHTRPLAEILSG